MPVSGRNPAFGSSVVMRHCSAAPRNTMVSCAEAEFGERRAGGDEHLRLHEVDIGDLLGHGVLDLDTRVHLDEDVLVLVHPHGVDQEFDGAGVDVADRLGELDGIGVQSIPQLVADVRRRCDLDDLLIAALHRAVAFEQVQGRSVCVGENLHLDVTRPQHRLLQEHGRVTERAVGLPHRSLERTTQLGRRLDPAHAPAAAACNSLREDRKPDFFCACDQHLDVCRRRRRPQNRNTRGNGMLFRGDLVSRHLEHVLARPDERDSVLGRSLRQLGVLAQETVARVDRVGTRLSNATRMISLTSRYARTGCPISPIWYASSALRRCIELRSS